MADFRLVERDGIDTLHRWPAHEECNLDESKRDTALAISEEQALQLIANRSVIACKHCFP